MRSGADDACIRIIINQNILYNNYFRLYIIFRIFLNTADIARKNESWIRIAFRLNNHYVGGHLTNFITIKRRGLK